MRSIAIATISFVLSFAAHAQEPKNRSEVPLEKRCTEEDPFIIRFCVSPRFFDPSARIYFDTRTDDPGEIDLFHDGNVNPTLDMASIYFPWRVTKRDSLNDWSWGPMVGVGISAAPGGRVVATRETSNAPVVMVSYLFTNKESPETQ
jgi:hypothetical protein